MINSNLAFLQDFLDPIYQLAVSVYETVWSAENRVRYSSRLEQIVDLNLKIDLYISINPKIVRDLSSKEKLFIYKLIRSLSIQDSRFCYLLEDYSQLLKKRGWQCEEYFYLTSLSDNLFAYELDCKLTPGTDSRRILFRQRGNNFGRKQLSLRQIFEDYLIIDTVEINLKQAKRKVRHKGYRDHGSLGSDFSKTQKQQAGDWSIREKEEERRKRKQDYLQFLRGFAGFE